MLCVSTPFLSLILNILNIICSTVKHTLKYFATGSYGVPNIPECMVIMLVDDIQTGYCETSNMILHPRKDWAMKILENDPKEMETYIQMCFQDHPNVFRTWISILKQQFNQSAGVLLLLFHSFIR